MGVFDGDGHVISHLTVTGGSYLGLFGRIGTAGGPFGPAGKVCKLGLEAVDVCGTGSCIGGLAGSNGGAIVPFWPGGLILQCYSSGTVSGTEEVGGLVGSNTGNVTHCYSTCQVTGAQQVGGLAGANSGLALGGITASYSTGAVSGQATTGGLVGYGLGSFRVSSFWDVETSGQRNSSGGISKTTAEMQMAKTFTEAGWDFVDETANGTDDIWWIDDGKDYPRLWWEAAEQ